MARPSVLLGPSERELQQSILTLRERLREFEVRRRVGGCMNREFVAERAWLWSMSRGAMAQWKEQVATCGFASQCSHCHSVNVCPLTRILISRVLHGHVHHAAILQTTQQDSTSINLSVQFSCQKIGQNIIMAWEDHTATPDFQINMLTLSKFEFRGIAVNNSWSFCRQSSFKWTS